MSHPKPPIGPHLDKADKESWRIQLAELNSRSRMYSTQLWQVPFAYLGLTGAAVASAMEKHMKTLPLILLASMIFGGFVVWHVNGMLDGLKRAVGNINLAEKALGLPETAKFKANYTEPLRAVIVITAAGYTFFAAKLWFGW